MSKPHALVSEQDQDDIHLQNQLADMSKQVWHSNRRATITRPTLHSDWKLIVEYSLPQTDVGERAGHQDLAPCATGISEDVGTLEQQEAQDRLLINMQSAACILV